MKDVDYRYGRRVTIVGIAGNIAVAAFKYVCGVAGNSGALIADAVHSVSDIIATVAVLFGIKFSSKPGDKSHPYGHGKIESLISLFIGILLIVTAFYLLYENSVNLYRGDVSVPSRIAVICVIISIGIKEWMFRYTISAGKKTNSPAIIANAWDHRSDAYSSIGVLIGISLAKLNMPYFDAIAAIVVSFFIVRVGYKISRDSVNDLIDSEVPVSLINEINNAISECKNKYEVKEIKGRRMGPSYIVDLKLRLPPYISAKEGTKNINELRRLLLLKIKTLQDVIISIETDYKTSDLFEIKFKNKVKDILSRHSDKYVEIHKLYYHFLPDHQEIHFHMVVPNDTTVYDSHNLAHVIQGEIQKEFPDSEVIIHIEPDEEKSS
ncbi:cation-efflux pump [bacterium]|nr:cation-efflux pump [bacterium]